MQDQKQQIIEQIRTANNVLITVNSNPTVDELAAAMGMSLALNKMNKHATTVFSGVVPSTIEFLQPEKTIETTTDSLRDFIIALDKSKADKLRYKVENDVVRIFITPYRTSISEKDLEFSQGDFNVDVVVALGVSRRDDLDRAITAHGRILHDAVVISLTNREQASELGTIHWQDQQASSLCEMTTSLVNDLQAGLLDSQMATALLTGIVAETDRFKNEKTSPQALSYSSQLMSAGANQQLIAEKLEKPLVAPQPIVEDAPPPPPQPPEQEGDVHVNADGELEIDHSQAVQDIHIDDQGNLNLAALAEEHRDVNEQPAAEAPHDDLQELIDEPHEETPALEVHEPPVVEPEPEPLPSAPQPEPELEYHDESPAEEPQPEQPPATQSYIETPPPRLPDDAEYQGDTMTGVPAEEPHENASSMSHHKVIKPIASDTPGDKPFDLQAAIAAEAAAEEAQQPATIPSPDDEIQPTEQPEAASLPHEEDTPLPPVVESKPAAPEEPKSVPHAEEIEQTLKDLEHAVNSPHVEDEPKLDAHAIRDSVAKAADATPPTFPAPKVDLGATPVEINPADAATPVVTDPQAPPPVPPPMMPQFYDANGKNDDPFSAR